MKKSKLLSILCGLAIFVVIVIMVIRLGIVAEDFSNSMINTLDVAGAVQLTAMIYGIIIGILTTALVLINVFKK